MSFLYINSAGEKIYKHSYSAGVDWSCPYKYYLRRILGWREKDIKASLLFGRALESAIQYHHEHNGHDPIAKFKQLWGEHKENKDLVYTKTEASWESLDRAGSEMIKLYTIRQPNLPIPLNAQFQCEFTKEVFPGDENFGGIEHGGKLDITAAVDYNHPMLPKKQPNGSAFRRVIGDIKTSALDLDDRPGIVAFDKQLRNYSWLTGISDVFFLWFKKCGHRLSKGCSITLLENCGPFSAGNEAVVAHIADESIFIVKSDNEVEEMEKAQGRKEDGSVDQTKAAKERKLNWLYENAAIADADQLSRQRLQFNAGIVTPESAADAGKIVAQQITEIVNAWKTQWYPQMFGVRFPDDSRNDPYFRAFCLKDEMFKSTYFVKSATDNFDDLTGEDEPSE